MLRKHFDFGGGVILCLNLEQFPVPLVCRSVYPVHSLYRDLLTIDKVICFTIFHTSFCDNLELENIVTIVDRVFHRCTVNEVLSESGRNDTAGIVDFPSSHAGNALDEITAFFLDLTARLHFDVIVHIFLRNLFNGIFFQFKAGALLPLVTDFVQSPKVSPVTLDHDTVRVELDYFQPRNVSVQMFCQLKEE